ncbi:hypothetical protein EBE87_02860 [Pseudoroseomonas wenyumeiae]|uniref:Uncharacterized protein n=1 Tax=Teichococcus wenyumeiae TaxID=2478470 RepID=A0A3A9JHR8_9PROT|nr:hypothetical protein D6Z83_10115 [Pseudoroseomonas wenyumeiae]RMI27322.1 hypothetical protein EBE87_02860 [Pseudoroseomonas wenyumeiae]
MLSEPLQDEAKKHGLQNVVCPTRAQIFSPEYGRKSATFSIKPGNADLILLAFWRQHPGYEYYWVMEFDVYTPRGLSQLAELDRGSDADLLGTYIRLRRHHASWDNWGSLETGPSQVEGVDVDMVATACFLPLSRYSARLLAALDWSYQRGWIGHHEATIATVAACNGMKLQDLNTLAHRVLGRHVYSATSFNHEKSVAADALFFHHPIKHLSQVEALDRAFGSTAAAMSPQ